MALICGGSKVKNGSSYKLTYFNVRGRAETSRLLFAAAGQKYEDERVDFKDWPQMKSKMPLETLPVLFIDGKPTSSQSMAIARHLAREFRLYGKNNNEAAIIDEIVNTSIDFITKGIPAFIESDPDKKKAILAKLHSDSCPIYLAYLEQLVSEHGKDGYAVASSLSLADLAMFSIVENMRCIEFLEKYPKLKANRLKVSANKNIAQYLKTRPESLQ